jgi:dCMP deaminase
MSKKDIVFLGIAEMLGTLSTCGRRQVGCVIVDRMNRIVASGYNGVPMQQPHCTSTPCAGRNAPSGESLDLCEAIHAEQNALIQAPRPEMIHKIYVTTMPCAHCMKMLLNTSCYEIVTYEDYAGSSDKLKQMWIESGRQISIMPKVKSDVVEFKPQVVK